MGHNIAASHPCGSSTDKLKVLLCQKKECEVHVLSWGLVNKRLSLREGVLCLDDKQHALLCIFSVTSDVHPTLLSAGQGLEQSALNFFDKQLYHSSGLQ